MEFINLVCTQQAMLYLECLFLHFLGLHILNHMQFQPVECMGPLELFHQCLNLEVEILGHLVPIRVVLLVATLLINRTLSRLWVAWGQTLTTLVWRILVVSLLVESRCPKLD